MDITRINQILDEMKAKLAADPLSEQAKPNEHHDNKLSGARKRLSNLYKKLTANRGDDTQVKSTGARR